MIKAVLFDLDGVLINSEVQEQKWTKEYLDKSCNKPCLIKPLLKHKVVTCNLWVLIVLLCPIKRSINVFSAIQVL